MGRVTTVFSQPGSLGISFEDKRGRASVKSLKPGTQATDHAAQIGPGCILVAVGGTPCDSLSYANVINLIRSNPGRPLQLIFQAPKSAMQLEVEALYGQHNPEKLPEVEGLIEKYGEKKLLSMVRKKYVGVQKMPEPSPQVFLDAAKDANLVVLNHCISSGTVHIEAADEFTGNTALMEAACIGWTEGVKLLLKAQADIHNVCNLEQTALIKAAGFGHSACAMMLINHGAKVDAQDHRGMTGYAYACEHGFKDATTALIHAGCDVNATNREGFTGLDRAKRGGGYRRGFDRDNVLEAVQSASACSASAVEVTFTEAGSLGLSFASATRGHPAKITAVKPNTQAMQHPELAPGMTLLKVAGESVGTYEQGLAKIKAGGRPLTLTFALTSSVEVTFTTAGSLGLSFNAAKGSSPAKVSAVKPNTQATQHPELVPGMTVVEVAGEPVGPYSEALAKIKAAGRPLTIKFERPLGAAVAGAALAASSASPNAMKKKPAKQRVAREASKLRGMSVLEDTERAKVMAALAAEEAEESHNALGAMEEGDEEEEDEMSQPPPAAPSSVSPPSDDLIQIGKRYRCAKRSVVRTGFEMDSDKVGIIERGDTLELLEKRVNEAGTTRVRFERGWMSATTTDGAKTVEMLVSYRCLRRAMVRCDYEMDSEKLRILEPGATLEVTDRKVNEAGIGRLKFSGGWTSERMTTGEPNFEKLV